MRSLLDEPQLVVEACERKSLLRRRRLPRATRRQIELAAVIMSVLLIAVTWVLCFSSVFALEQVVVDGVRAVAPADVVSATELDSGVPLARVGVGTVEERVRAMPAISRVRVSRRWPHTIVIEVVERNRLAVIKSGGGYGIMDETGYVFARDKKRPLGLPTMEAPDGAGRISALAVLEDLPLDLLEDVKSVNATNPDDVELELRDGVRVSWGSATDSRLKLDVLRLLLRELDGEKWIDVRVPANPSSAGSSPTPAPPPVTESPSPGPSGPTAVPSGTQSVPSGRAARGIAP